MRRCDPNGLSDPPRLVDAATNISPAYTHIHLKAVPKPTSLTGNFTWSTNSGTISLTNTSAQDVIVNASATPSNSVGAESVSVLFTPSTSSSAATSTHNLTVVHCIFTAYADNSDSIGHGWWSYSIEPLAALSLVSPPSLRAWSNIEIGYYPIIHVPAWVDGFVVVGPQGEHRPTSTHPWDIPFSGVTAGFTAGLSYSQALSVNPGSYNVGLHNCCHETIAAAAACGVSIPASCWTPNSLHIYLSGL